MIEFLNLNNKHMPGSSPIRLENIAYIAKCESPCLHCFAFCNYVWHFKQRQLDEVAYLPAPKTHTMAATRLAMNDDNRNTAGMSVPTIAMLVSVAKRPPAGVKPPYMKD